MPTLARHHALVHSSNRRSRRATRMLGVCAAAAVMACSAPSALAVSQAALQVLPDVGYGHRSDQFGSANFVEQEVRVSGLATTYKGTGTLGSDGRWNTAVVSTNNPYNIAIIVRRPANPAAFNGIVVVEWLNVSTGYPLDVDWGMSKEEFLREGYAYIGVANQKVGLQGVQKLKQYGTRYADASISSDDLSYDIFSQVALAVRQQAGQLLGGLQPVKVIGSGHSQSAAALITYVNAIHPKDKVFDGFLIHGRSASGLAIGSSGGSGLPSSTIIRSDLDEPVIALQSEMDVAFGPSTSKPADTAKVRYWEVAGSAHADQYLMDAIYSVSTREIGFSQPACASSANAMPFYEVENVAFNALRRWTTQGIAAPAGPKMQRDWLGAFKRDANGNVLGGIRLPEIDVPVAKYGYTNFTTGSLAFLDLFACVAGGNTEPFAASKLLKLYPTHADYVSKYKAAADAVLAKGFIRPADYVNALQRAQAAKVPQ